MDEKYDVIVLGTGLKECIVSGMLSVDGKKVLHMDQNKYYGGESASLTPLEGLFDKFHKCKGKGKDYGRERDWNVDLIPKFLMANGQLVKMLMLTGVTRYLEFKSVEGSYVYQKKKIHKVPADEKEALKTPLLGMDEKKTLHDFLQFVQEYDESKPKFTEKANGTAAELYKKFQMSPCTQELIGHAVALYPNDDYMQRDAKELIQRCKLYSESLSRYGKSPYLYPLCGLGELPQGFARLSAIYGGTYMLDKPGCEIVYEGGKAVGVKDQEGSVAKCDAVVCDPSYAPKQCKTAGQVVRAICILKHPVPDINNATSVLIILPQGQLDRKDDIYISVVSDAHQVCCKGYYLAIVSTIVETDSPEAELKPGLDLLGEIEEKFVSVTDLREPTDDGKSSKTFITKSYDATTHFETTCDDAVDIYKRITGQDFDFSKVKQTGDENNGRK